MTQLTLGLLFVSAGDTLLAGHYDATALRSPLAVEEHFQTSLGREKHRFEGAPINRYRLYDFYARQAKYHLKAELVPDLLLPYPGLQGGRQGHWGNSNEPRFSAVTDRVVEPEYHRLVQRRDQQFVVFDFDAPKKSKAVCLFDPNAAIMRKVVLKAAMRAPVHGFSYKVDRTGFNMWLGGQDYFSNAGAEWLNGAGVALKVGPLGYYLHGAQVVYRRQIGGVDCLDLPRVSYEGDLAVYSRVFEWGAACPGLTFVLPKAVGEFAENETKLVESRHAGMHQVLLSGTAYTTVHEIRCAGKVKVVSAGDGVHVQLPPFKTGETLQIRSWIMKTGTDINLPERPIPAPSTMIKGGRPYYEKTVMVEGVLDADPAAKGSGYAIDDIPVPVKNPYGVPMTASGLAFDAQGSAYISTLVGDVWKVTGLDGDLKDVIWRRFASGIPNPLGLEMVGQVLYVTAVGKIVKLHDLNHDGEADYYERFTKAHLQLGGLGSENQNLERDAAGNFYLCGSAGIFRISPDGEKVERISDGARNPLGLGVRPDGLALSDSSEGSPENGTCTIYESQHPENENSVSKRRRILYLPRGVDNSPGSRLFLDNAKFGPLGQSILGTSYGSGRLYTILRDPNHGTPQAAMMLLPMEAASGAARVAVNPANKDVYVVGFDAWGDFAVEEGSFNRIRYTEEKCLVPTAWQAYRNGISVTFNTALDPASTEAGRLFLQQWNYADYSNIYGSPEFSVRHADQPGHDHVQIISTHLSKDGRSLFIEAPDLLPAMCTQLFGQLRAKDGATLALNLFATLNQLNGNHPQAAAYQGDKPLDLLAPAIAGKVDSYTRLTQFFDKRAGRDLVERAVAPAVPYTNEELNYDWIHQNVIQKQCMICHLPGTAHDFSTYDGLVKHVDLSHPGKSALIGMMQTGSMPPFPLPTVAPGMRAAVLQWIRNGANRKSAASIQSAPLSSGKPVAVSGEWKGRERELSMQHVVDNNFSTIWAAPENARTAWIEIDLGAQKEISLAVLGDGPYVRTRKFELQAKIGDGWDTVATGTTIGVRKFVEFDKVKARMFRLEILEAIDVPTIAELQLFE